MGMPKISSLFKYVLPFCGGMVPCSIASAQKPTEVDRIVRFDGAFSASQSKFIHEGIRDQDPAALIWIDVTAQKVLVRAHSELDREQLQAAVGVAGLQITYLGPPVHEANGQKSFAAASDPAPAFYNTGDAAADNARYELEKRAWIEAHPDLYQQQQVVPAQER